MARPPLRLQLGHQWQRFAQPEAELQMLGTVQDGLQIGALAQARNGDYLQVNGDMVRVLNRSRVDFALDRITGIRRKAMATPSLPVASSPPVVVVIRKRRRLLPDTADFS